MSGPHSHIGASSMHRWMNCPGSVRLSRLAQPLPQSPAAAEGTKAHELAAKLLQGKSIDETIVDMDAVLTYVKLLSQELYAATYSSIEKEFDGEKFYPGFFGTCDAVAYYRREKLLRVYDYKHGKGHRVEVENNVQCLYYAFGAILEFGLLFEIDTIEMVIVQPRMPNRRGEVVHRWQCDYEAIIDFGLLFLRAAEETKKEDSKLTEGAWCYWCPAVKDCPEQFKKTSERIRAKFTTDNFKY